MSTFQNQNQFKPTPMLGSVDMTANPNIKSARLNPASVATVLTAGTPVKLVDVAGTEVIVDACADVTEKAYGVIIYDLRKSTFVKGDTVDIACRGSVVYLETSAAIARGAKVQCAPAGPTVATLASLGTNVMLGTCLDKPAAANVLARIEIDPQDANLSAY